MTSTLHCPQNFSQHCAFSSFVYISQAPIDCGTCRWLTKRLSGFTHLICSMEASGCWVGRQCGSPRCRKKTGFMAKKGAAWLVTQLPRLCKADVLKRELHLSLTFGASNNI